MKALRRQFAKIVLAVALAGGWVNTSPAQVLPTFPSGILTSDIILESWNLVYQMFPQFYTRAMTPADAQQLLSFYNRALTSGNFADYEALGRELFRLGLIRDVNAFLGNVSGADQATTTANSQVVNDVIQNSIFEKAEPAVSAGAKSAAKAGQITTVFGADAFYQRTEFDGGAKLKGYGTNLSLTFGDRFQFRGTVPVYKTDFGGFEATTYGVDLNGKYRVSEAFALGAHANYITNDSDLGDDKSWTAGVYAAASARMSDESRFTFGLLFDRVNPDGGDETWLGAAGINWGLRVGRNSALNPYAVYYRNLDAPRGSDRDWYDLGLELQVNFTETWATKVGLKSTLGLSGVDRSYQVYLGSAWRF